MIVFFHFIFSFTKYLWVTYVDKQVAKDLKVLFETISKTEAFEKYENRRLNLESLGVSHNENDHNLKWTTDNGEFFRTSDFKIDFDPAFFVNDNIRFNPPAYLQRYLTAEHIINNPKWGGQIKKVVEFGTAEMAFLNYLKNIEGITEINLVDIDGQLLKDNVYRVQPWYCESYTFRRRVPLTVNVLRGSVSHPDRHCKGVDAVIAIELIEHMYEDELSQLPKNIFGYIRPRVAIFTTPNSEFNVLFINFSGSRHPDHKFEWTRKEFESWANTICEQYPEYEVHFIGIGPPPVGREDLGYCSQGAVFMRLHNDADYQPDDCEELNTDSYELIESAVYPVVEELAPEVRTLIDAGHYIRVCENHGEFQKDYKTVIPLSSILVRVYKTCKSTAKLRQILEEKYKIEENSDGEEVLVYSGESDSESDSDLDENCLVNVVQDNSDENKCNYQWEQESDSSWGSVKEETDTKDNLDKDSWGAGNCDLPWNCEETEQKQTSEIATKDNFDYQEWGEESLKCAEIEQIQTLETATKDNLVDQELKKEIINCEEIKQNKPSPANSLSDVSCDSMDNFKEMLTNFPSLKAYSDSDFIFDPNQQSESNLIPEDARSVGLETIVSVSDENYESSNVDSNSQIRTSDSSFVMDDRQSFNGPGYWVEGFDCEVDLAKSKSLQNVGEKFVFGKSGHDLKGTKSLESLKKTHQKNFENCGDDLKNWKTLHCVSAEQKNVTKDIQSTESKTLDTVGIFENMVENPKNPQLDKLDLPECKKNETDFDQQLNTVDYSQNTQQATEESQDDFKTNVDIDSQEFCYREEKLSSGFSEEQLSDFDSTSSLNRKLSNRTVLLEDSELVTEHIPGNNFKLPESVQESSENFRVDEELCKGDKMAGFESSCFDVASKQRFEHVNSCSDSHKGNRKVNESVSDIEFENIPRPSKSKDSDLSYKSCDTSIREEDNGFGCDSVGNTCLPDLEGLGLSKKQSSSSMEEPRKFSSTSFIYKSQSQEKIKQIFSFKSIGSDKFESDAKKSKIGVSEGKGCDSSPLHKCYSTGKIGKDFSAYNEGAISNSCVDKFPSCLASELEFFDKNNELARERRCMSVSCIGNINVDYDENSCLEERELQNSCSPDKFGPDSGYPNSSCGLDMEMDTPEQVKEIMTESESSFDESPLESPLVEDLPFENNLVAHAPVIPVGDNVENGDVANNNRDGEGNNMVGPGVVGDILEFHALIEENEGNLQLMEAGGNVQCVEERKNDVDELETTTELEVNDLKTVVEKTCESSSSSVIPETNNNSDEKLYSCSEQKNLTSHHCLPSISLPSGNNSINIESSTSHPYQSVESKLSLPTTSTSPVSGQGCCSFRPEQNRQSRDDLPASVSSSMTNNSSDQGYSSSHNLPSTSSSATNYSGSSNSHPDHNLRLRLDLQSTTNEPGSSNFHPEQNLWSPSDLPSTSSSRVVERDSNSDGLGVEEFNIEMQNMDLNSLVPLSLFELVLNGLLREMAEDVLLQMEIDNALVAEGVQLLDADAVIEHDPTDFMAGGDSAAENM